LNDEKSPPNEGGAILGPAADVERPGGRCARASAIR